MRWSRGKRGTRGRNRTCGGEPRRNYVAESGQVTAGRAGNCHFPSRRRSEREARATRTRSIMCPDGRRLALVGPDRRGAPSSVPSRWARGDGGHRGRHRGGIARGIAGGERSGRPDARTFDEGVWLEPATSDRFQPANSVRPRAVRAHDAARRWRAQRSSVDRVGFRRRSRRCAMAEAGARHAIER